MSPRTLAELDPGVRRSRIGRSTLVIIGSWTAILGLYVLLPFDAAKSQHTLARLLVGLVGSAAVLVWLVRRIINADLPQLRAVEALGAIIPLFVATQSGVYLLLANARPGSFTEPLDHVSSLYFTVTVLSTVGFGDITARTDLARLFVTGQMLLDLVLVATVIRLVAAAMNRGLARRERDEAERGQDEQGSALADE